MTVKRNTKVANPRVGPSLRSLVYHPEVNPLVDSSDPIAIKRRFVSSGLKRDLVDPGTGEIVGASVIREVVEKDDAEFVKVFSDGVKEAFGLSKTASRVFTLVLEQYQNEPMVGGYAASVYLAWFGDGLSGKDIGMTDRTFQTGLRELLAKRFLAPRSPNVFWVNSALFFKGDRVLFVREYRRNKRVLEDEKKASPPADIQSEEQGQLDLGEEE